MTTNPESLIGQQVHFLSNMNIPTSTSEWATAAAVNYGDVLDITEDLVEAGYPRDRRGHWLELANDEAGQIARWNEVKFGIGPFPSHLPEKDPYHVALSDLMSSKYRIESVVTNSAPPRRGSFSATQGAA